MNDRERIVALFVNYDGVIPAYSYTYEEIADHLTANGVTIQKQGRWVMKGTAYACSECGCGFPAPVSYCFSCGAKMQDD